MLENFANNSTPSNPIEGQLWYDSTAGTDLLKVYDGTTWQEAGGIKRVPSASVGVQVMQETYGQIQITHNYICLQVQVTLVGPNP